MTLETRLETKMEHKSLRDNRIFTNSLVVTLGVTWGLAFVAIRTADFQLNPINLTVLRWLIASAGFLSLAPFFGRPKHPVQRHHIPRILAVSLASVTGYHLSLNYAETIVSAGLAGLLISLGPIFVVVPFGTVPQGGDREETRPCACSSDDWGNSTVFERWIELSRNNWSARGCFLCFHVFGLRGRLKATSEGVWSATDSDMGRIDRHCIHTSFDQHEFHHPDPTTLDDNVVVSYLLGTSKHGARQRDPIPAHWEPIRVETLNPALHSSIGKSSRRNSATRRGCDHPHG